MKDELKGRSLALSGEKQLRDEQLSAYQAAIEHLIKGKLLAASDEFKRAADALLMLSLRLSEPERRSPAIRSGVYYELSLELKREALKQKDKGKR